MDAGGLSGVVIAFDLDNTLLDPTGRAYRQTVLSFLESIVADLGEEGGLAAWEDVRRQGPAMERLGLANAIHERSHPHTMALFMMKYSPGQPVLEEMGITPWERSGYAALLYALRGLDGFTRHGTLAARLEAEINLRQELAINPVADRFRAEVERLAEHPLTQRWSSIYRALELSERVDDRTSLIDALEKRGAEVVVISEGRVAVQEAKLARLGLLGRMRDRLLISREVADLPGITELHARVARLIERQHGKPQPRPDEELAQLWRYHVLAENWSRKTPWFFARCLHALKTSLDRPRTVMHDSLYLSSTDWGREPLRFVMVGDRLRRDIEPLLRATLGRGGMTLHLRAGKYASEAPDPDRDEPLHPDRTFGHFDRLADFLASELNAADVRALGIPPAIAPREDMPDETIRWGRAYRLGIVQTMAEAIGRMVADGLA